MKRSASFSRLHSCADRPHQGCLRSVFFGKGLHDILVYSSPGDDVVYDHGLCLLALPPEAGIGLLIQFQTPCESEPDQRGTACLQVQTVTSGSWVDHRNGNLPGVPVGDILAAFQFAYAFIRLITKTFGFIQFFLVFSAFFEYNVYESHIFTG